MSKMISDKHRKAVEKILKDYPYLVMSIEASGLGYPTRWDIEKNSTSSIKSSFIEGCVIDEEETVRKVEAINYVLSRLDEISRKIIEEWYFQGSLTQDQIQKSLLLSREKYYKLRNEALRKFVIALGFR